MRKRRKQNILECNRLDVLCRSATTASVYASLESLFLEHLVYFCSTPMAQLSHSLISYACKTRDAQSLEVKSEVCAGLILCAHVIVAFAIPSDHHISHRLEQANQWSLSKHKHWHSRHATQAWRGAAKITIRDG